MLVTMSNTDTEWVGNEVYMLRENVFFQSSGFLKTTRRQISEGTHIKK
jgi:hypothetical protein